MPILTPQEITIYAPQLLLTGAALDSALISTQLLIEGALGAKRPLGVTKFTDTLDLSGDGRAYLSRLPVLQDSQATPINAKIRGGMLSAYGMTANGVQWQDLDADELSIDSVTGEVQVLSFGVLRSSLYTTAPVNPGFRRNRPMQSPHSPTLQIEYWAGFDFAVSTPEVETIKQMFGQVLALTQSDAGKGIRRRKVEREYEVEYQTPVLITNTAEVATTGNIQLDNLLKFFHQYRPRSYAA